LHVADVSGWHRLSTWRVRVNGILSIRGDDAVTPLPGFPAEAIDDASGQAVDATVREGNLTLETQAGATYRIEEA